MKVNRTSYAWSICPFQDPVRHLFCLVRCFWSLAVSEASVGVCSFLLYQSASVCCARYLPVSPLSFCECSPHTLASYASITPHTPRSQKAVVLFLPSDLNVVQCVWGGLHVYWLTTMFIRPEVALRLCITTISQTCTCLCVTPINQKCL